MNVSTQELQHIKKELDGEFYIDNPTRLLYATDASAYREIPLAVAVPRHKDDLKKLIKFAHTKHIPLIPRATGTSLAGQVVGSGIIVDISKYFNKIIELNQDKNWVYVEPGVVRDELNIFLEPFGLFFGPETSTSNRATLGGMVGNNSCGTHSLIYGSTREHLLEVHAILSDGSEAIFRSLNSEEFKEKCAGKNCSSELEKNIYQNIKMILDDPNHQKEIRDWFPKPNIPRRNTGYALDILLNTAPFTTQKEDFNFCKLIAGSEGTLAFITAIKLNVVPLPPKEIALVCIHFKSVHEALLGNLIALQFHPSASELMDHYILECTKTHIKYKENRFFVQGDPKAILVVEFTKNTVEELNAITQEFIKALEKRQLGYHYPIILGKETKKVWDLRKAGLGLLANVPGDAKPAPVIEDTAVDVQDLPQYIDEFNHILQRYGLYSVHYAHAGSGELHLRPILDLKSIEGQKLFRTIAEEIAQLVRKYKGSLSGEHGDGRLRGEFIAQMIGDKNYSLLKEIKQTWDPHNIFNPGKIVDAPPMDKHLRYDSQTKTPEIPTYFSFEKSKGILRATEQCNGSGDCRKSALIGGTMCPSYMATRNEKDTTRARANLLRETLTNSNKKNPFDNKALYDILDLCLSCKGCKAECPSNVDMAKLKGEFLQHYYETNSAPFRSKLLAHMAPIMHLNSHFSPLYNFSISQSPFSLLTKKILGLSTKRSLPKLYSTTLRKWYKRNAQHWRTIAQQNFKKTVYLFCDEFSNYLDVEVGIKAIKTLSTLGYIVEIPDHKESARAFLSKGFLKKAKKIASENITLLSDIICSESPLIGIEPSAILSFRDEYLDLVDENLKKEALHLSKNCLLWEEFISSEIDLGNITTNQFVEQVDTIYIHGHCHQKSMSSPSILKKSLSILKGAKIKWIPSGCCGMAGSFGYEKEHFDLSMEIGNLVLFPTIKSLPKEIYIAASGTSCRHQIWDGTSVKAFHTAEILWKRLKKLNN